MENITPLRAALIPGEPSGLKRYIELTLVLLLMIVLYPILILWHYHERQWGREDESRAGE